MRNNGIVNTGNGTVVATGAVIGTPNNDSDDNDPNTNNGVINSGDGDVVITGTVMGSGNRRRGGRN
jgi:hypothetical protein